MKLKALLLFLLFPLLVFAHSHLDLDPYTMREGMNSKMLNLAVETIPVFAVEEEVIKADGEKIPLRIYRPEGTGPFPVVLFIHGGGWVAGNLDTHDNLARYLCKNGEGIIVSVGYQNSPEGKFPAPLEQCYDALVWATKLESNGKLLVAGDSAGGNLSAALALLARDRSGPAIHGQILINPPPDLRCREHNDQADIYCWMVNMYVNQEEDRFHPYASPLLAKDHRGLPSALILIAELDMLREDGLAYATVLKDAGVPVEVYCQRGVDHLGKHGARASPLARNSLEKAASMIKFVSTH